ncbi:LLM class flavin-dependent oxidoreductase [Haliangium sp.]|uniref:LLM class flavin-dependent oxidoreductase n=1 Tax=Haliangium sp. TaxID=2663208 RepID=UPI003D0F644F
MSHIEFCWVLPSTGDDEILGQWMPRQLPTLDHLGSVVRAAEDAGFESVLITTGQGNNHFGPHAPYVDSLVTASAMAAVSEKIKLLVAIRTGVIDPAICARMCATLDMFSNGRFMLNVVSGGAALEIFGETLDHDARYRRTGEAIAILKGLWTQDEFSLDGEFYSIRAASCYPKPVQTPHPPIYFSGQSEIARDLGTRESECMLVIGRTLDAAREYATDIHRRADQLGRRVRVGTHFYVVARASEAEAHRAAGHLLGHIDPRLIPPDASSSNRPVTGPPAPEEMLAPCHWAGMSRYSSPASTTLIGSYEDVAAALRSYIDAGLEMFILHGYPMLEEVERLGTHLLPLLRD